MLDMWHTFAGDTFGASRNLFVYDAAFLFLCILAALILLHFLRVAFLKSFGRKYRGLSALNRVYVFDDGIRALYEYKVALNSKKQLERYNFDRFFLDEFARNPHNYTAILNSAAKNERQYRKYRTEAEQLLGVSLSETVRVGFFDPLEVKLCKRRLVRPVTAPVFRCTAEYTSPKGKNHYTRSQEYTAKNMEAVGKQYLKNMAYQNSKAYQRSLMTDSLRYDIMKRDHFRCVLCGRSAKEGVKLHVDHIVPVAKGGLTVPENLRTLCDRCNLGKRDKYDPNGVN